MIPLAASQSALVGRPTIEPVVLVLLTVYSDRENRVIDTVYSWTADRPVEYDYGATGTPLPFDPVVAGISGLGAEVPRIPDPQDVLDTTRQAVTVEVDNAGDLYQALKTKAIVGASLEIAEILLPPDVDALPWDLRGLPGDEHVVRFRGEVISLETADLSTFTLRGAQPEPELNVAVLLDPTENDSGDVGTRLPIPVGRAKHVRGRIIRGPFTTTLAQGMDKTYTGVQAVSEVDGFPPEGTFRVLAGDEVIECDQVTFDPPSINIVARGVNSSVAVEHQKGEVLIEVVPEVLVGFSTTPASQIRNVYLINPFNAELVRVTSPFTVELANTAAIPGRTVSTVSFAEADFKLLLTELFYTAKVTQQADYSGTTQGQPGNFETDNVNASVMEVLSGAAKQADFINATPPVAQWYAGQVFVRQYGRWTIQSGDIPGGIGGYEVKTWALRISAENTINEEGAVVTVSTNDIPGLGSVTATGTIGPGETKTIRSGMRAPSPGPLTVSDLVGLTVEVRTELAGSGADFGEGYRLDLNEVGLEVDYYTRAPDPGGGNVSILLTRPAEILAAGIGFGLQFFADVDGAVVPVPFSDAYLYDEDAGWNAEGGTHDTTSEGQRITVDVTPENSCEDLGDWSGENNATLSVDPDSTEGAGSILIDTISGSTSGSAILALSGSLDMTGQYLVFDVKALGPTPLQPIQRGAYYPSGVAIQVANEVGITNWRYWSIGANRIQAGEWSTAVVDLTANWGLSGGSFDPSAVTHIRFYTNSAVRNSGHDLLIDNVRLIPKEMFLQRNATTGVVDLTTALIENEPYYRQALEAVGGAGVAKSTLYFSNAAGAGTTPPVDRREVDVTTNIDGVQQIGGGVVDFGDPSQTFDNVETIGLRVELAENAAAVGTSVDLQVLQTALATNPNYGDPSGTLIESGPDILRWFLADFSELGHEQIDAETWALAEANLAGLVFAGDLAGLGDSFDELLQRTAANMRAMISVAERVSGSVYRLHTSTQLTNWPAPVGEAITSEITDRISERLLGRDELANRIEMFYGIDPSLGSQGSENDYLKIATASKNINDSFVSEATFDQSIARIGFKRRESPLFFELVQNDATARDLLTFHALALMDHFLGEVWTVDVPHFIAYATEVGDVVPVNPKWIGAERKGLVIGINRSPGQPSATLVLDHVF